MADTWITDMTHYLTESGSVADMPSPAANLARYFGSIVAEVTGHPGGEVRQTGIRCRRRPRRKPCPGRIKAILQLNKGEIVWSCPVCGDNGFIRHWQGTPWHRTG